MMSVLLCVLLDSFLVAEEIHHKDWYHSNVPFSFFAYQ
jgi:hypothetical protein